MGRTPAKATRFDPHTSKPSSAGQNSSSTDNSYCDWKFYESDSYLVSFDLIGKAAFNSSQRTQFVYLGRKTAKSVSVIKFSYFEAGRLLNLVTQFLDEIHAHGTDGEKLIPFLDGRPGANVTLTRDNKNSYFEQANLMMQNVRARFCFSEVQGAYMLHLHSPVSQEISNKLKGWIGPVASLTVQDVERFEGFLKSVLEKRE